MRRVQIIVGDDLDWAEHQIFTEAHHSIVIGLGEGKPAELREIDLGQENYEAFILAFGKYWQAAHPVDAPLEPVGGFQGKQGKEFYESMRAWADAQGRSSEYRSHGPGKGYAYGRVLRRDWEAELVRRAAEGS